MGTRINATVEHQIADYRDRAAAIERLASTVPAARAVGDYWRSIDPDTDPDTDDSWTAYPPNPQLEYAMYRGPGGLSISIGSRIARIRACGRWRGFLSIDPLRRVHLAAFRSIAQALGSRHLAYFPSEGVADDLFPADGLSQDECLARLQIGYGDPQPSVEQIAPEIIAETEHWRSFGLVS